MSSDEQRMWKIRKYGRHTEKGWKTIDEGTGAINLVLQAQMSILVLQNATVLESIPLLINPETIKGLVNGDVLMIVINNQKPPRKFRVLFVRDKDTEDIRQPVWDCVNALRLYFPISSPTISPRDSVASIQTTTMTQVFQNIMTLKNSPSRRDLEQLSATPLLGSALDNVVRLCLLDSSFSALVVSVEKSLKSLTNPEKPMDQE